MLKLHHHNPAAPRPEHVSAEWVAHNHAMDAKRDILNGKGVPPVIGATYSPRIHVQPAIEQQTLTVWEKIRDVGMLASLVLTMALFAVTGAAVGF